MMTGRHKGQPGSVRAPTAWLLAEVRAGTVDSIEIQQVAGASRSAGTCAVMGTASTMACIAETLGMSLPAPLPFPRCMQTGSSRRKMTGKAAVELIRNPIRPDQVITEKSVENAFPRADGGGWLDQCDRGI